MTMAPVAALLLLLLLESCSIGSAVLTLLPKPGAGQRYNPALWGIGDDWTLGKDTWKNATLLSAIRAARVGLTRFPGGACSNFWNLTANSVVNDCQNATCHGEGPWCYVEQEVAKAAPGAFSTAAFLTGPAAACRDSNVVIDLNLLHFDQYTAPNLVDAVLASAGSQHNLTRWELGNEYYLPTDWPNSTKPQPYVCNPVSTRDGYAVRSLSVIEHIRQVVKPRPQWPNGPPIAAQVACQASMKELLHPEEGTAWNDGITSSGVAGASDAITLHDYDQHLLSQIATPFKPAALAALSDVHIQQVERTVSKLWPGKKVWMTEFGIDVGSFRSSSFLNSENHGGIKAMFVLSRVLAAVATDGLVQVLQYYSLGGQGWGKEAGLLRWDLAGAGTLEGDAVAQVFAHAAELAAEGGDSNQHAVLQTMSGE